MVLRRVIDTQKNVELMAQLDKEIAKLRTSRAFRRPLREPSCSRLPPPGMVTRTFRYRDGRLCTVKLHAKVMVALMRAMKEAPTIEITASADSAYSGSYRSYAQQKALHDAYVSGTGHRAADPCTGYHRCARAIDVLNASEREKDALLGVRVAGDQFYNGASFGDPPHYSWAAKG